MLEMILSQIYTDENPPNIILAHGQFPHSKYLIAILHKAQEVVCCDGSVHQLLKHMIYPDYIIGDCDSLSPEIQQYFKNKIIQLPDQNTNDLTKAVNFVAQKLHWKNVIILGATGLREDHTLANMSLLSCYIDLIEDIAMISDYGIFTVHTGSATLHTIPGQQISLFTLNKSTIINCSELKWPLHNFTADNWYNATLNQATHNYMHLKSTDITIVFRAFTIKE